MGVWKLVKTSFEIYCKNIIIWLVVCVFVYSPLCIRNSLLSSLIQNSLDNASQASMSFNNVSQIISAYGQVFSQKSVLEQLIFCVPEIFFVPMGLAMIAFVVKQSLYKERVVAFEILDNSLAKWKKVLMASCFYRLILLLPLCFIFPVVFLVSFYFYPVIIALSKCGVFGSMIVSHISLAGHLIKAAALILSTKLLSWMARFFISNFIGVFVPIEESFVLGTLIIEFLSSLVDIFFSVLLVVWFLDTSYVNMIAMINKKFGNVNVSEAQNKSQDQNRSEENKNKDKKNAAP